SPASERRNRRRLPGLLLVVLDGALATDLGGVGVEAGVAASAPLAQQVPALVERDLDLLEPGMLVVAQPDAGLALLELVLLGDECVDPLDDLGVVHRIIQPLLRAKPNVGRSAASSVA